MSGKPAAAMRSAFARARAAYQRCRAAAFVAESLTGPGFLTGEQAAPACFHFHRQAGARIAPRQGRKGRLSHRRQGTTARRAGRNARRAHCAPCTPARRRRALNALANRPPGRP